ncbi:hypothetical protein HKX48_000169 [Thoreauomyces humboldtii]|nr:hypothetical protein HKX48_000169 [Thoreauomyces humboldtii]
MMQKLEKDEDEDDEGGATNMALQGANPLVIRRWGRWDSDAWELYVRLHPAILVATRYAPAPHS